MIIADSDVLIDFLRGRGEGADKVANELKRSRLSTTAISAFELWAGVKSKEEEGAVHSLLEALTVLPLEDTGAKEAARIKRELDAKGFGIGMADSLIAGICIEKRGILLTRNRKHFERVPGLSINECK